MSGALKIPGVSDVLGGMKQTTPKSTPDPINLRVGESVDIQVDPRMRQLDPWCQAIDKIRPDAEKTVRAFLERNKDCGLRPEELLAGLGVAIDYELKKLY